MASGLRRLILFILCLLLLQGMTAAQPTREHPTAINQQSDALLQTFLQIYEIDRETERLQAKSDKLATRIEKTEIEVERSNRMLRAKQQRAGEVLRTLYMGEQDGLWLLALSGKSLTDILYVIDVLDTIYRNQFRLLESRLDEYEKWQSLQQQLLVKKAQLKTNQSELARQRARVLTMQSELKRKLAVLPDSQEIIRRLEAFANEWQTRGLPLFKQYFSAMARAVSGLPQFIIDKQQFRGTSLYILDSQLIDFLRAKNPLFKNTEIRFADGRVTVNGEQAGLKVKIVGRYEVIEKPKNAIRFTIEELRYQNYLLPDTTVDFMSRLYDLSIYPEEMSDMLRAQQVLIENGKLTIKLKISF